MSNCKALACHNTDVMRKHNLLNNLLCHTPLSFSDMDHTKQLLTTETTNECVRMENYEQINIILFVSSRFGYCHIFFLPYLCSYLRSLFPVIAHNWEELVNIHMKNIMKPFKCFLPSIQAQPTFNTPFRLSVLPNWMEFRRVSKHMITHVWNFQVQPHFFCISQDNLDSINWMEFRRVAKHEITLFETFKCNNHNCFLLVGMENSL